MNDQKSSTKVDVDFRNDQQQEHEHDENPHSSSNDPCNLIVNYLPPEFDDNNLKNLFSEHGEMTVAKVIKDKISKKSLGYGFVKFTRSENAMDAIERKNGMIVGEKKLKVSFARPSTEEIKNCKLYVTNLPKDFIDQDVYKLFSQFGEIIECRVLQDRQTKSNRGVAFVQFSSKTESNNALSLNGFRTNDGDRTLVVKYAEDQQKKKDRKELFANGGVGVGGMGSMYEMGGGNNNNNNMMMMQMSMQLQMQQSLLANNSYYDNSANNSQHQPHNNNSNLPMKTVYEMSENSSPYYYDNNNNNHNNNTNNNITPRTQLQQQQQLGMNSIHSSSPGYLYANNNNESLNQQQRRGYYNKAGGMGMSNNVGGMSNNNANFNSSSVGGTTADLLLKQQQQQQQLLGGRQTDEQLWYQQSLLQQQQQLGGVYDTRSVPTSTVSTINNTATAGGVGGMGYNHTNNNMSSNTTTALTSPYEISLLGTASPLSTQSPLQQLNNYKPQPLPMSNSMIDPNNNVAAVGVGGNNNSGNSGSVTLVISNLPSHANVATLHALISPYGRILSAHVDTTANNTNTTNHMGGGTNNVCSGRGQVQMMNFSQAQYAIQALNGTIMFEGGLPLQLLVYGNNGNHNNNLNGVGGTAINGGNVNNIGISGGVGHHHLSGGVTNNTMNNNLSNQDNLRFQQQNSNNNSNNSSYGIGNLNNFSYSR